MIPLLIEASRIMDDLFWLQAYGDREPLAWNPSAILAAEVVSPKSITVRGTGSRPTIPLSKAPDPNHPVRSFILPDMSKAEFDAWEHGRQGRTYIRWSSATRTGRTRTCRPYSHAYSVPIGGRQPVCCARPRNSPSDAEFANYLMMRADRRWKPTTSSLPTWPGWT